MTAKIISIVKVQSARYQVLRTQVKELVVRDMYFRQQYVIHTESKQQCEEMMEWSEFTWSTWLGRAILEMNAK
jgi:hypothetical protein